MPERPVDLHERPITLHRVGGFYEAVGINARIIVGVLEGWTGYKGIDCRRQKPNGHTMTSGFAVSEAAACIAKLEAAGFCVKLDETPGPCPLPSAGEIDAALRARTGL
jgi:hypothetical protein